MPLPLRQASPAPCAPQHSPDETNMTIATETTVIVPGFESGRLTRRNRLWWTAYGESTPPAVRVVKEPRNVCTSVPAGGDDD
jgi:hypothetical protein